MKRNTSDSRSEGGSVHEKFQKMCDLPGLAGDFSDTFICIFPYSVLYLSDMLTRRKHNFFGTKKHFFLR
eukprot:UN00491